MQSINRSVGRSFIVICITYLPSSILGQYHLMKRNLPKVLFLSITYYLEQCNNVEINFLQY